MTQLAFDDGDPESTVQWFWNYANASSSPPGESLGSARWQLANFVEEGTECPCCRQLAKVYPRSINSSMARDLIAMWRQGRMDWMHLPTVRKRSGSRSNREESKLRYWGLVVEEPERRPDGGRAGWWRITNRGSLWVQDLTMVPKYAMIYDNHVVRWEGPSVSIRDALANKFDYDELMQGWQR